MHAYRGKCSYCAIKAGRTDGGGRWEVDTGDTKATPTAIKNTEAPSFTHGLYSVFANERTMTTQKEEEKKKNSSREREREQVKRMESTHTHTQQNDLREREQRRAKKGDLQLGART